MRNKILDLFTNLIYQIALYGSGLASAGFSYQPKLSLSRGISYYGQMLISALMTCVAHLTIGRKNEEIQRM